MMPENVNWDGVLQSFVEMWLPLFGVIALVIIAIVVWRILKKRKKK